MRTRLRTSPVKPKINPLLDVSPRMRLFTILLNGSLVGSASVVILIILTAYINPPWLRLINALHELISAHVTLGMLMTLCILSAILGIVGVYTIRKRSTLTLGLQIFALVFLAVLEVGILYGFLSHWLTNLNVGVTFAVQLFRPGQMNQITMAAIQSALHCCGRGSYNDYYIANEGIPFNYVPFSCCDTHRHGLTACRNVSLTTRNGKIGTIPGPEISTDQLVVPKSLAFEKGCQEKLQTLVLPLLLCLFCTLLFLNLCTTVINGIYLHCSSKAEIDESEIQLAVQYGDASRLD